MTATIITKIITYILRESTTTENKLLRSSDHIRLDPEEKNTITILCYYYNVFLFIKL